MAQYRGRLADLQSSLTSARRAEAEAWERDRPAREGKAREQNAEIARLERLSKERADEDAAERERMVKIEQARRVAQDLETEQLARIERDKA